MSEPAAAPSRSRLATRPRTSWSCAPPPTSAGTRPGLTQLLGLPASTAARAGRAGCRSLSSSAEYQDLAAEDLISSLPGSILPADESAATLRTAVAGGRKVYVLSWTAPASGSDPAVSEQLVLDATSQALPVSETTTASGFSQTVTLSRWGEALSIIKPAPTVPYTSTEGR